MEEVEQENARNSRVVDQPSALVDSAIDIEESRVDVPKPCEVKRAF